MSFAFALERRNERSWQPLLEGARAGAARAAVEAVALALAAPPPPAAVDTSDVIYGASLSGGSAGIALLFGYLHAAGIWGEPAAAAAYAALGRAADTVASVEMEPSLFTGFCGVGWSTAHLVGERYRTGEGGEDPVEAIDEALLEVVAGVPWNGDYDLVDGLTGLGVYALERIPLPGARACLELILDRLFELAVTRPEGVAWHTPSELLPPWQREVCPDGHFNLGVAHGVSGVIALLGGAYAAGVRKREAGELLDRAVSWLMAQRRANGGLSFTAWVGEDPRRSVLRLAWCYRDLGISAALLAAADAVGNPTWEREARQLALGTARLSFEEAGVKEIGLCHGSAGVGHLLNRMSQSTGDEELRDAARTWLTRTLDRRREGDDADRGLLTGAAGVALALLASVSDVEPAWDRMLLISLRPPAA